MNNIYWFTRKNNGESFCIEGEQEAGILLKRRDFKDKFAYIGKSSGKHYQTAILSKRKLTPKELEKIQQNGSQLDTGRTKILADALALELEEAKNNIDKSKPIHHSVIDVDGSLSRQGILGSVRSYFGS